MIDLTLNQPLLASPSSRRGAIAPGLLRVLQQAVAIRLVLAVLAPVSYTHLTLPTNREV